MRIVALEEHVSFPEITKQIPQEKLNRSGKHQPPSMKEVGEKLADIETERLKSMDENGVTVQVLSVVGIGADLLDADEAPAFAKEYNDTISGKIKGYPDRFAAFAHLPMVVPEAAADELERTVNKLQFKGALINGLTNNEFLDNEKFAPILAKAQELDVPIYLHPGLPPKTVYDAYYSGLPRSAGDVLSVAGWGWHSETAIHILRMIIAGTFDKFPSLKIIIGHMGEMLPMMMARCNTIFQPEKTGANQRSVSQTLLDQVYITTSGIFTEPPFIAALNTFGIDKILFSIDYPFAKNQMGRQFLDNLNLNETDMQKLAHRNADKLLKL